MAAASRKTDLLRPLLSLRGRPQSRARHPAPRPPDAHRRMGIAEPTRALAPSCGHVIRRSKHPGAGPASHAGRTARTALPHRDASRVEPPWSGEGSVRPLAVANAAGPVAAIRRAQPAATLAQNLGEGCLPCASPQRRNPWAIKRGKAVAAPGEPITGVMAGLRPLQGAWRAAVRPDARGRWAAHVSLFWLRSAGGYEPGLSGAGSDGPGSRGASDRGRTPGNVRRGIG